MQHDLKTFKKGVHPPDRKELARDKAIESLPLFSDYYISTSAHIGAPAKVIVSAGEEVAQGQLIARNEARLGANVYSSVSGVVVGVERRKTAQGGRCEVIHIKQEGDRKVLLPDMPDKSKESILARIDEAGIVGLGGAGFPAAFKDKPNKPCDLLVINGAECEPYLNCDFRLMVERAEDVAKGIKLLQTAIGVEKAIVGIEENKPEAIEAMKNTGLEVMVLKKRYPQGAEKMLIYAMTGRKVPANGGLPSDVGCVVHNIATAYAVYDAVENNEPLYKRVLTVSGKGVERPSNLLTLNGTQHADIFNYCGIKEEVAELISGGPMMGHDLEDLTCSTTKAESGLLALMAEEAPRFMPTPCISCGSCARACPMNLMPMYIDFYTLAKKTEEAVKYGAMNCMECGCCAYVCPAKRPLVQSIRLTKQRVREEKQKK
ncbi:MAG: electron transport complex subunit RsxC [Clostridia bacterium]|nr:electron transport complex subunit RsxC [Clostridia bacterium]MBR2496693.1 electron transport complex subunit RsxC [Clostridia bacterium]